MQQPGGVAEDEDQNPTSAIEDVVAIARQGEGTTRNLTTGARMAKMSK
jgi:hypothetical protein